MSSKILTFFQAGERDDTEEPDGGFRVNPLNRSALDPFTGNKVGQQHRTGFPMQTEGVVRSASFSKIKDNLGGVIQASTTSESRLEINAELEEIRACPRIKKMFNISRPNSGRLARSASSIGEFTPGHTHHQMPKKMRASFFPQE